MIHTVHYQWYKQKKTALETLLYEASDLLQELQMEQHYHSLHTLKQKVTAETFKVMVLGQFKTGKSTFINSFLGGEILPAYATPCTAVINEVKYGREKRAVLFFKDPLPKELPPGLPSNVLNHMRSSGKPIPPMEIPVDEIEDYVVIPMGKDPKESVLESPYEKLELYWPLPLLENGVELIDSPGLNEHETRTKVTMEYLSKTDAVLFLMSCLGACAKTEMDFIEHNLKRSGFDDVFYLFNRFDQVAPKERERVRRFGLDKLHNETSFGENGIFFISAYEALTGKLNGNTGQFQQSGMEQFEKVLAGFLVNQRGKIKLTQPSKELKRMIAEALFKTLPQLKSMLSSSLHEIEQRYGEVRPRLQNLEVKKRQMEDRISLSIERMMPDIRRAIGDYFRKMERGIPEMLEKIEPEQTFQTLHPKESSERIINELLEKMQNEIEVDQLTWQNETLTPLIEVKIREMLSSIEGNVETFYLELDNIKINVTGSSGKSIEGAREVSAFERIGAAALGLFAGDVGAAAIGVNFGFGKTFFKQLALQISAVIAMVMFGITNPVTMLPVIIGLAAFGFFRGRSGIINQLKGKVASGVVQELEKQSEQTVDTIVADVKKKVQEVGTGIGTALEQEIQSVKLQVESIISDLRAGEAEVAKKRKRLEECEGKLIVINQSVDDFIIGMIDHK